MAYLLFIVIFLIEPLFMAGSYSQNLDASFGHALLAGVLVAVLTAVSSVVRYHREP